MLQINESIEKQLKREVLSGSYFEFFKWGFKILFPNEKYEDNFHVKYLCDVYQAEIERIIKRIRKSKDIIVNIPPRTSKTLITSVLLNAWTWLKDPTLTFICTSFDDQLVLLNSRYTKDLITSTEYKNLFGHIFYIRKDASGVEFFMNNLGGFRMSKTTGSNITGHKGCIIICDDLQNPKTAESEVFRKNTIEYYTRALYNRLTPVQLGVRIIICQRLHEDDISGYLLKNNPGAYKHICLPAEVSPLIAPKELAMFYKNGLLDPVRLDRMTLTSFRNTLGTRGYSGQYEQTPSPDAGGIIKAEWFDIVRPEILSRDIEQCPICFTIDSAYTSKSENDPTGILAFFKKDGFLYILDYKEVRMEFPELINFLKSYFSMFQYSNGSRVFIEPKASGKSIVQQLRSITMFNVIESEAPKDDKITRAHSITPTLESRRVKLIDGNYIPNFLENLKMFPNSTHDEAVDTLIMMVQEFIFKDTPDYFFV